MSESPTPPEDRRQRVASGALAGGGVGTIIALIANNLSEGNTLKSWLTILSPSIAVGIGAIWLWLRSTVEDYARRRAADRFYEQSRRTLEAALTGEHTSEEHKKRLQGELEELELLYAQSVKSRVRSRL